jgi:predicted nucleic acid-binding Zn ribbon protein
MPGNPHQCRLNAKRCLKLAEHARRPEMRQTFTALAETWTRLAAELEADQTLLQAISEMEFSEPYYALPSALKLHS